MLHVVTIVLDGMPWLPAVYTSIVGLKTDWMWHISHGVALPVNCTSWCKSIQPRLSKDGTTEFLREIKCKCIKLYEKPSWRGKIEMVNAGMDQVRPGDIVMQMDSDEVWQTWQIERVQSLLSTGQYDEAMFMCRYFITPNRVLTTPNTFGNWLSYEWKRAWYAWRGFKFKTHEPPSFNRRLNTLSAWETARQGLIFDHFAYATRKTVEFKEKYYGYAGAVAAWDKLCNDTRPIVDVSQYLSWVKPPAIGTRIDNMLPANKAG